MSEDEDIRREGERDLELNHTHYLMLDDGRLRKFDIKDYRTNLCLQIAKYHEEHVSPSELSSATNENLTSLLFGVLFSSCREHRCRRGPKYHRTNVPWLACEHSCRDHRSEWLMTFDHFHFRLFTNRVAGVWLISSNAGSSAPKKWTGMTTPKMNPMKSIISIVFR